MKKIINIILLGTFFGTFGTTVGGIIGASAKNTSNKKLSFILEFSAGLMTAIICFDLIPEAKKYSNLIIVFLGLLLGIINMVICEITIKLNSKKMKKNNYLLKTGILIGIGLAVHNFPEGLAIGAGLDKSLKIGIPLAIAIAIHDIPEGISMALPMKTGGMPSHKVIIYTFLSGITTGIGAFLGGSIGYINKNIIGLFLSFAAGAMIYIVSGEIIPESNKLYNGRISAIGNILGFVLGIIVLSL